MIKEYPESYLEWVEYLIGKKIYGAWIKDVSTYITHQLDIRREETRCKVEGGYFMPYNFATILTYNTFGYQQKSVFVAKNIYGIIDGFISGEARVEFNMRCIANCLNDLVGIYRISGINWCKTYKEFCNEKHPKIELSRKLSRKLYRTNNKISSGKHTLAEEQYHVWYDKSYEKNKFSKKAWRK